MNGTRWIKTIVLGSAMVIGIGLSSTHGQGGGAPAAGQGAPGSQGAPGGQRGGPGGGQRGAQAILPDKPTAVSIPAVSAEVTGPGTWFDSSTSLPPGRDMAHYKYEAKEYFIKGTANGKPYSTRIVVRKPSGRFSGLVILEAMHPSGAAHMFEFTSDYTMSSGHMAVEVVTNFTELLAHNKERYKDQTISNDQVPEVLAQAGALVRSKKAGTPFANLTVRKMVMAGTSATAGILSQYLPAHMVYRAPDMQRIFDGFLPMSTGANMRQVDVPLIHVPTMTEVIGANLSTRDDGDAPGDQFRMYQFAGMAHVDSRDSVRFKPDPCRYQASQFPVQAYMSVALRNLLEWVDKGKVPPRAERIAVDRDNADGSPMALDENGNAKGGIRNPYVDVPVAKFAVRNEANPTPIPNPSKWIADHGANAPNQMCGLAGYQVAFSKEQLQKMYGNKKTYQDRVKKSVAEMEKTGWSLPVYRDMILQDAAKVDF
jgi:hypothetical protein